jgi:tetratricopeptide (TPR) repeat protein
LREYTETFAEHQFGKRIVGKRAYERNNGDHMSYWDVEIVTLCAIYADLIRRTASNDSFPYLLKSHAILKPWIHQIGLSERERIDVLDEGKIEILLVLTSVTELKLSEAYKILNDLDKALHHCEQSFYYTKQIKGGEKKTRQLFEILKFQSSIYTTMDKYTEAKISMEEAYTCVSEIYDPEHPLVIQEIIMMQSVSPGYVMKL